MPVLRRVGRVALLRDRDPEEGELQDAVQIGEAQIPSDIMRRMDFPQVLAVQLRELRPGLQAAEAIFLMRLLTVTSRPSGREAEITAVLLEAAGFVCPEPGITLATHVQGFEWVAREEEHPTQLQHLGEPHYRIEDFAATYRRELEIADRFGRCIPFLKIYSHPGPLPEGDDDMRADALAIEVIDPQHGRCRVAHIALDPRLIGSAVAECLRYKWDGSAGS